MHTSIRRALISVSNKRGVVELARALLDREVEILSTGGTARLLTDAGLRVVEVADYTGFPELMDGRVKTLHPRIHGGILGRRGVDEDSMAAHGIAPIDLVVVNLYPFEQTIEEPGISLADAVEEIDIGGPALLRAAAKNHAHVTVLVAPEDYPRLLETLAAPGGQVPPELRFDLAVRAFEHTARYDGAIASYLGRRLDAEAPARFPRSLNLQLHHRQSMRYGENPHQPAAFYSEATPGTGCVGGAVQVQGKALSFNNIADADAALECVKQFPESPACVIVKHANPCGVATAETLAAAYERAYRTDPTSAFGGIIAFNRPLDADTARMIIERQFVEVIVAPALEPDTVSVLAAKPNVRVLSSGSWSGTATPGLDFKRVVGGLLVQDRDVADVRAPDLRVVTKRKPDPRELADLLFAWRVAKFVKSNAIVYARDGMTVGVGAGQMSRVYSARIAALKAADEGLEVRGAVMASDAFFPFRDGLDAAASSGITAVVQPGGSLRDEEVIAAADEHDMAMAFTGIRHFRH